MASNIHYLLCFIVLVLLPCSTMAQTSKNISLDSSLTAKNDDNSSWPSPSGEFAIGFQQIVKDGFLLAIWFDKIQEKTIVWSANGDSLVPQGSKVEFTSDGYFVLNDAKGNQVWSADYRSTGVSYAAMLDTGNFVIANQNSAYLWESFDEPTDTMLPFQSLQQNGVLYARYTRTNYTTGRFMFTLQSNGHLLLYTTNFPQNSANSEYWSAKYTDIGFQVIFNQSGLIYFTSKNGSILNTISANSISPKDFYQRATLDYDGVLRHYIYPKSSSASGGRSVAWSTASFIPPNICLSIVQEVGFGACGFNSLCKLDDAGPTCLCPDGYSILDPDDKLKGCKQDFVPQSCDRGDAPSPEDEFDLKEMQNTDMPYLDYELFQPVSEDWCRQSCLEDCFCVVAIFKDQAKCYKKGLPFSNGRIDPSIGTKALIKKRKDNSTLKDRRASSQKKKDDSTLIIVGSVLLSSLGILNFILPLITYVVVSRMHSRKAPAVQPYQGMNLKYFTYGELKEATNEFKEELGRGASATVFKGMLACDKGNCVAVKILDAKVGENDLEFNAEVKAIGRTNHRNLVQLLGYCNEGKHRILVYEYMSNGTLASFLFGESRPNWNQRRQIALGVSKGLLYLHEECSNQVVHCDIKPQNILLDDSFTARISDFGLAKLLRLDQTRTITGIRGTKGYVAPEWFKNMPITAKVDVYSFGILLLEIICCRKKFDEETEDEDQMILADWVYDCYSQKKLHLLLEKNDEAMEDIKIMEKYVMIAMWCIQEDPSLRPTMQKTIHMLDGTVEVPVPPDPSSYTSSIFLHIS